MDLSSSSSSSSSLCSCPWEKLPDDVKAHIICRLREEEMIRLKVVSKDWCFLISNICIPKVSPPSPSSVFCGFILRVVESPTMSLLDFAGVGYFSKFTYEFDFVQKKYTSKLPFEFNLNGGVDDVLDSCNGLVLLIHCGLHYVCNPATFQCFPVPPLIKPPLDNNGDQVCFGSASLAFDPTKSLEFNIIYNNGSCVTNPLKVETFSSETWEWSSQLVAVDDKLNGVEWIHRSAYSDGVVYRMLKSKYILCIHLNNLLGRRIRRITSSSSRVVRAIELPQTNDDDYMNGAIGISKGRLHYCWNDNSRLCIWMLKEDDECWTLRHEAAMDDIFGSVKPAPEMVADLRRSLNRYRQSGTWFKFYGFHPNSDDQVFFLTPRIILRYRFGSSCSNNKSYSCELVYWMSMKKILPFHNNILPYSRCSIVLNTPLAAALVKTKANSSASPFSSSCK